MPGITGFIRRTPDPPADREALEKMVGCMAHEPFYSSGTYVNEELGLWIGWTSHKGAFGDCLPVWNERRDVCLVFSGEDFTDEDDLRRLLGQPCSNSDAGYLVRLYEAAGISFIQKLNGWFSGVVVDLRNMEIILFNDRYGLGRVYYHENADGFHFSSEAKSLLEVLPRLREIDMRGLAETFSCGCVLQQRTLFPGVSLLPGGASWRFARDRPVRKDNYFNRRSWEAQATLSPEDFYGKLKETFPRVLARYLRPKGAVAMSITGGLDTRCIMVWAHCAPGELPCYTFGGSYRECADVRIGRRVARACQQEHTVIPVTREFLADFPALAERTVYYTDGVMDVSGAVELYVNRLAREIAPVRLTGNYGDEVLRGVVPFRPARLYEEVFTPEFAGNLRRAEETYAHEIAGHRNSFIAFKQVPWHHYSRLSLERTQLTIRSPYLDNELVGLAYQAPPELASSPRLALQLIAEGNAALSRIGTDRGVLLRPMPVITRAHRCWREFTFKAEYAYDYGMPQWLAAIDHKLAPLRLERLFLGRHKFYHFRVWYRDALGQYLRDILLAARARGRPYIRGDFLEQMVSSHISGRRNYTRELHRLLTAELMQRLLIEQK